jgi:two-component system phosphate regulon response regulator PhoB
LPKILIVDDDRMTTRLLQTLLELDGFEVVMASRGAEVPVLVREQTPDLMLIDYHLSDMKGVEVVTRLRAEQQFARLPIVMTSGLDVQEEAQTAGANRFLVKPFEPSRLLAVFRELLG